MISRLIDVRKNSFENIDGVVEGHIFTFIVPSAANKYAPTTVQFYAMAGTMISNIILRECDLKDDKSFTKLDGIAFEIGYKYDKQKKLQRLLYARKVDE
jgi:hypothetical protein